MSESRNETKEDHKTSSDVQSKNKNRPATFDIEQSKNSQQERRTCTEETGGYVKKIFSLIPAFRLTVTCCRVFARSCRPPPQTKHPLRSLGIRRFDEGDGRMGEVGGGFTHKI